MAKKIQDGNQIVTNVDSNDNLTFSIKSSFIDSTPTANSTNLVTSGGVKSALDINTTDIAAAVIRIANNETNISNNTDDIEALENAVSTNTTNISTNTTDIDSLETTVGTLSTNVNANTTKIGTLSNLTTTNKTNLVNAVNELNAPEKWVSVGKTAPTDSERVWFNTTSGEEGIYVDEEEWYSKPKVLWTNPNMQSPFASQTITLNESLNNFKYYEILFMSAQGTPNEYYSSGKILANKGTRLTRPASYLNNRQVTIASDTTITFGDCVKYQSYNSETTSVTNFAVIPYKILGYK